MNDQIAEVQEQEAQEPIEVQEQAENVESAPQEETEDKSNFQKRVDKLTREKREALEQAAYYRGLAEAKTQQQPEPESVQDDRYNYDSDEEYIQAQVDAKFRAAEEKRKADKRAKHAQKMYAKGSELYDDFEDVAINSNVIKSYDMYDAVEATGDDMPEIMYHLGSNPKIAKKLHGLSKVKMGIEIGKIQAKLKAPKVEKKQTNAPSPPPRVKTGGSPNTADVSKMTFQERRAAWDAERLRRLGVKK